MIASISLALNGCGNYEQVKLAQCDNYTINDIKWYQHPGVKPGIMRYSFNRGNSSFSFTGIIEEQADSVIIAAMSDLGVTLFTARWTKSNCKIIINNTSMSDVFLLNGILADIMVSLAPISSNGNIMCDIKSGVGWIGVESEYLNKNLYYVTNRGKPALLELKSKKIVYEIYCETQNNGQLKYHIENKVYGYYSDIRY